MHRLIVPALVIVVIAIGTFGAARSLPPHGAGAATNLITNGTFDADVAGWAVADGNVSLAFNGTEGNPAGAARVLIITSPEVTSWIEQCVAISGDAEYSVAADARVPDESYQDPDTTAAVRIDFFSDGACTTSTGAPFVGPNWTPDDPWIPWSALFQSPLTSASALVQLTVTGDFTCILEPLVFFDNVVLEATAPNTATATASATPTQGKFRTHTPTATATPTSTSTPAPAPSVVASSTPTSPPTESRPESGVGAGGIAPPNTGSGPGVYGPSAPQRQLSPSGC